MKLPSPDTMGDKFKTYLMIQTTWWVGVYALCYRYQPTRLVMQTPLGRSTVTHVGGWLQRVWPSRYKSIAAASEKVYTSPNGRTFGEWLLINKLAAPVALPFHIGLANHLVNRRKAVEEASTIAGSAMALAAAGEPVGPDLQPDELQRRLSKELGETGASLSVIGLTKQTD